MQHINTEQNTHFNRYIQLKWLFVLSSVFHHFFLRFSLSFSLPLVPTLTGRDFRFTIHFGEYLYPCLWSCVGKARRFNYFNVRWVRWLNAVSPESKLSLYTKHEHNILVCVCMSWHKKNTHSIDALCSFFLFWRKKKSVLRSHMWFSLEQVN